MGSHIVRILGVRKFRCIGKLKYKDLHHIKFSKCVSSFPDDLVKRPYMVDA